jgi:cytochrome c-type biogenesis protein
VADCHQPAPLSGSASVAASLTWLGLPLPALVLAAGLAVVGIVASAVVAMTPFDAAAFGGLTVPVVLGAGVLDGLNPCAFALLVLFATYTLVMVNRVTSSDSATTVARNQLLGAGSIYVAAVLITYFLIGLGLFSFLGWLGQDHLATRVAAVLALLMGLWMMKDVLLPGVGPTLAAPRASHGWMHAAMERGGMGGMLLAGVLVGLCTVPCSGAIYLGIVAVLSASGGGPTGLALLALYNLAFIVPLLALLAVVSNRRVLGSLGRWNQANSPWVKAALAVTVIAMSLGLLITL